MLQKSTNSGSLSYTDEMRSRAGRLVKKLVLMEHEDDGPARAGLASLRAGLRARNGICLEAMPLVAPYLGSREEPAKDQWFFAIAALFALHPMNTTEPYESLGSSFAKLRSESDSIEKRFQLLLSCDQDSLFNQLVQIVSLLKSKGVPVNWYRLLTDLTLGDWDDDDRDIQKRWARDFYKTASNRSSSSDSASE